MSISPDELGTLIRARRTTKQLDADRPVDPEVIAELCALATWAPNHRRTEPWRFAVFTGDARRRLGDTLADALEAAGGHESKVLKTRTKYLRAPVVVVVGSLPGPDELTTGENRDAVAAGIGNFLLGATSRGLGTLWSTMSPSSAPAVLDLCGFPEATCCVGAVYLGYPTGEEPLGRRSVPLITWVDPAAD